ncbi:hypothetical protein GF345_06035 [Candidatus Woesearchaeota archaeon]|nr:hypothetical protein [Candidatus Woesearchaeota archaeon]
MFFKGKKIWWMTLKEDQDRVFQEIVEDYQRDKSWLESLFSRWKKKRREYEEYFKDIRAADLSKLDDDALLDLHDRAWNSVLSCRQIDMIVDPFTYGAERFMLDRLEAFCKEKGIEDMNNIYSILITPEKDSFISQKDIGIIRIARKVKGSEDMRSLLERPEEFSRIDDVKDHLDRYCWTNCSWGGSREYTAQDLIAEIKELLDKDLDEIESRKKGATEENIKRKKDLIEKHGFARDILDIAELTAFFSYLQDLRKENALMFIYYENMFLKEFSRRFNMDIEDLKLFDITEIKDLIKNNRIKEEAEKRKGLFLIEYTEDRIRVYTEDARKYFDMIVKKDVEDIKELKGRSASSGKAIGIARVIYGQEEFSKFKEGDILVTGMTRPEFTPLMKKAKAIVTNDGGVTCHAAIFSREFEIPCIIGTRIATKVLKDGDKVEVNADKGIVRRIE